MNIHRKIGENEEDDEKPPVNYNDLEGLQQRLS
jgi:hypothetical protein